MNGDGAQQQLPAMIFQDGSMDPHYPQLPAVDPENLLSAQTLPGAGYFTAESDADGSYKPYDVARSG
jgi:hypothetical protein